MSGSASLLESLRQMLALLEGERQALAVLDLERILVCADGKQQICSSIEARGPELDDECRGMLEAVRRLNDVNRKMRNLIAANVQSRLSALTGNDALYQAGRSPVLREQAR